MFTTMRFRLAWSAGSAVLVVLSLVADWLLRASSAPTALAPTRAALWLSVGLGAALGAAGAVWGRYLLRHQREFLLTFHRATLKERLRWKYQRWNLLLSGWFLLALWALIALCYFSGVFVLPAIFAGNAVYFAWYPRLWAEFGAELRRQPLSSPRSGEE